MREKIKKIWPEIELIKNDDIKEKTYQCWEYAIDHSPLEPEDLENIPFSLLIDNCDITFMNHKRTCVQLSIEIAKIMEHEALLIKIGLNYVNENEKQLFYKNILEGRLQQYRKEIGLSLEVLKSKHFLITDDSTIENISKAKDICQNILNSHDRYLKILQSLDTGATENSVSPPSQRKAS